MKRTDIQAHLNAPRLRLDTWCSLALLANEIEYISSVSDIKKDFNDAVTNCLDILEPIEHYHAFPGTTLCNKIKSLYGKKEFNKFHATVSIIVQALHSPHSDYKTLLKALQAEELSGDPFSKKSTQKRRHYFEVLVVEDLTETGKELIRNDIESYFAPQSSFVYELVFVNSFEDAIIATLYNFNIKCCLISDFFKFDLSGEMPIFKSITAQYIKTMPEAKGNETEIRHHAAILSNVIRRLRQNEIDLLYLSSYEPEKSAATANNSFNQIFYDFENYFEMHLTIIRAIKAHYETPFFDSLLHYTFEPKSTFHALPVARGKSIFNSRWINDMQEFYGKNIFLAESSSTAGGLDSLMNPTGSIRRAMEKAARFFGAHETFFVTNGTSAANKVVLQTVLKPADIVLVEHICHESHYYGIIQCGAYPVFLNGYHIDSCNLIGPVTLRSIKEKLLLLKKKGKLDKVKLIILTNCTFDGLVYNVQRYMEEILAIKPDIIFLWDEAWFAYGRCVPHYRLRTGMFVAALLEEKYKSASYREEYNQFKKTADQHHASDEFMLNNPLLPDPDAVKIQVYSTQSTHKTLSCLRQGSMIHVYNSHFESIKEKFTHAFVAYSTTSPNYQIIATMDLARRQAELEGFELVQHAIELSMIFRQQVNQHPLIRQYFKAMGPSELIPEALRQSNVTSGYSKVQDWEKVEMAWVTDDIVIDPTRVTLLIKNHLDGYKFRNILMDRFGIQVNKVSLNSVLFQFNIGTLRSSVSYLLESLYLVSNELKSQAIAAPAKNSLPSQPDFSEFNADFIAYPNLPAGDLRKAYYLGYEDEFVEYMKAGDILKRIKKGEQVTSAAIIIPVPPGYPALLPGQVITAAILQFLSVIDPSCIIGGYAPGKGLKVFKPGKKIHRKVSGHNI